MAKHVVKCKICGKEFDLNQVQGVIAGPRRYAHQICYPAGEIVPMEAKPEDDPEYKALTDYIYKIFGDSCNWAMTKKYIKKFKEENGYSYSGMLKSLVYFFEIKKNPIEKANNSIGIIPFCYQDAYNYYLSIFLAQNNTENKTFMQKVTEYAIRPRKSKGVKIKELDWGTTDEE